MEDEEEIGGGGMQDSLIGINLKSPRNPADRVSFLKDEDSLDPIFFVKRSGDAVTKSTSGQIHTVQTDSGTDIEHVECVYRPVEYMVKPIDAFLRTYELRKLGMPERRLQILNYSFQIVSNRGNEIGLGNSGGTLYRALAQAVTNVEQDHSVIRHVIVKYLLSSWPTYGKVLVPAYEGKIKRFTPEEIPQKKATVQRAYLDASLQLGIEGTVVELGAAAKKYGFTYTLFLVEGDSLRVLNCQDEETKSESWTKYFFLRTGDTFEKWCWEYLVPYGIDPQKIKIPSGVYPMGILNSYPFNRGMIYFGQPLTEPKAFEKYPAVFILEDGRVYGCLKTPETDIYSNLSIILYQSPNMTIEIFEAVRGIKKFPNLSKSTLITNLNASKHLPIKIEPGTLEDVRMASKIFGFTYTIYSLDENVNFLKLAEIPRNFLLKKSMNLTRGNNNAGVSKHFTFLTRTRKQFPMEWCVLTEIVDSEMTKRGQSSNNVDDYRDLADNKLYPLIPLHYPYTEKKKGLFGIKYRVLRKEAHADLKALLSYTKPNGDGNKNYPTNRSHSSDDVDNNLTDFSDESTVNVTSKDTGRPTDLSKKEKGSFQKLFSRSSRGAFRFRNNRVVPEVPPEEDVDPDPQDDDLHRVIITYEEE